MKKTMVILALTMVAAHAQALVADRLKCTMQVTEVGSSSSAKMEREFVVVRLPLSGSPDPDVLFTGGSGKESVRLRTHRGDYTGNLNIHYQHALKVDEQGRAVEARQMTCLFVSGNFCESNADLCVSTEVICGHRGNPFDPIYGWTQTALFDGVPAFNERSLFPLAKEIRDRAGRMVGRVEASCQFLGTFQ